MTKVAFSSHSVVRGFENSSSEKNRKKHLSEVVIISNLKNKKSDPKPFLNEDQNEERDMQNNHDK